MDIEQSKCMTERYYKHQGELMPRAVYNFTILENLVSEDGKDGKKSTRQLINRLKGLIADHCLMKRYPADERKISDRPRWQVRFSTALRQLRKENYIEHNEKSWQINQEARISNKDVYSLTEKGKSLVNDYKLIIDSRYMNC